jgi:RimJ/RimL family protein N-acetyltransferase
VELVDYTDADLPLTEALECDPLVMDELGGPIPKAEIPKVHRRRLASGGWWLKIIPDTSDRAAGAIGVWPTNWRGHQIHETGWMLLPEFQGRGLASEALELLLRRIRADLSIDSVHAFPSVSNAPSNALCRKFGFALLEQCDGGYAGRTLRCNHWELVLGRVAFAGSSIRNTG